jgi:sugar O-acyltransferase (sialic acid O-acetyltransferase NeuD family)
MDDLMQTRAVPPEPSLRFLVWGGGGHGRMVGELIAAAGHRLAGFIDRDPGGLRLEEAAEPPLLKVDESEWLARLSAGDVPTDCDAVALGIGDGAIRMRCHRSLRDLVASPLLHPSATISASATLGRGSVVLPRVVVNAHVRVGEGVILNTGAIVEHDCIVSDGVHLSPGAILCGDVSVGVESWIGAGAVVVPGIRIGTGVTVGAGAVVLRHVPDGTTVVGNPAKSVAQREDRP